MFCNTVVIESSFSSIVCYLHIVLCCVEGERVRPLQPDQGGGPAGEDQTLRQQDCYQRQQRHQVRQQRHRQ